MHALIEMSPWLLAMAALIGCSAFFSGSEAALFYVRWQDRRALAAGGPSQRAAAQLLSDPDRLLSAVLLWNLAINMTYFGISAIIALRFEQTLGRPSALLFSAIALVVIIFLSEMAPKSLAVLSARRVAGLVGIPLAVCVRLLDPIMPMLRLVSLLSRRLLWPGFRPEPQLELSDLERAIDLSGEDASLVEQERATLRNIVRLSDMRVDECMRPRTQFVAFRPPVTLNDLAGQMTPSGYLLITESDREEVAGAVNLMDLVDVSGGTLDKLAQPVIYVPWCATVADVLEQMWRQQREVSAVVNEFGETIGILTFEDILDTLFRRDWSRSDRLLNRESIKQIDHDHWHVTGMTGLRRLGRHFAVKLPRTRSVTVGGMVQELLQRLAEEGDEVDWGPFHFRVLEAPRRGLLQIELTRRDQRGAGPWHG